jgi:pSer/pThr/pTyr-binding forkhead associated (FHA) protein
MTTSVQHTKKRYNQVHPFSVKIELLSGPMDGMEIELTKEQIFIGRDKDKDIPIPLDGMVSRSHAKLSIENGKWWLEDLGSRNGTFLNEKKIEGRVLINDREIFRVGVSELRFINTKIM